MAIKTIFVLLFASTFLFACSNTKSQSENEAATYARYVPERKDDFAWENDLIAFRAYGPALRNSAENAGIDCWLKKVKYPIINKWYKQHLEQDKSYHVDHGEGLDNYSVGSTAGCGGTSLWIDNQRVPLETYTKWEIIESNKDKTIFSLNYESSVGEDAYIETKRITIETGKRVFKVESTFTKNGIRAKNLPITIGLTMQNTSALVISDADIGYALVWEKLGDQFLGTGIKTSVENIQEFKIIPLNDGKHAGHSLIIANTNGVGELTYYAGYAWAGANEITTVNQWQAYLSAH